MEIHNVEVELYFAGHADHEVLELFVKRNFRCDCGTTRLSKNASAKPVFNVGIESSCCLEQKVSETLNVGNTYNHNFLGRYCRCDQPYDPEKEARVMLQCFLCEDWVNLKKL